MKVLYIVLGIVVACLLLECTLRITDPTDYNRFENDPVSGLIHYKKDYTFINSQSCYTNTVITNNEGLHAPEPPPVAKKSDEFRIIIAGSSFAEGLQVPQDKTVSADLENLLNSEPGKKYTYEVIPVAFSGNGTFLDILYYLRYGAPLKPDLVVDITTEYEHTHDGPDVSHFNQQGTLVATLPSISTNPNVLFLKNIFRDSKLIMNVNNRLLIVKDDLGKPAAQSGAAVQNSEAKQWQNEEQLLGAFAKTAASSNAPLLVASWTTPLAGTTTAQDLHAHLAHAAAQSDFYYDDMLPVISQDEAQSGVSASWDCDAHWSATGDTYAAQAIFEYLEARPALLGT